MANTCLEETFQRNIKLAYKDSLQDDDEDSPRTPIKEALRSAKSKTAGYKIL